MRLSEATKDVRNPLQRKSQPQRRNHHNRILIAALDDLFGTQSVPSGRHRDLAQLDIKESSEFVPANLNRAGYHVWIVSSWIERIDRVGHIDSITKKRRRAKLS